jgi:hypothetical protein
VGTLHLRFVRATLTGRAQESRKKSSQVFGVEPHDSGTSRKERSSYVIRT